MAGETGFLLLGVVVGRADPQGLDVLRRLSIGERLGAVHAGTRGIMATGAERLYTATRAGVGNGGATIGIFEQYGWIAVAFVAALIMANGAIGIVDDLSGRTIGYVVATQDEVTTNTDDAPSAVAGSLRIGVAGFASSGRFEAFPMLVAGHTVGGTFVLGRGAIVLRIGRVDVACLTCTIGRAARKGEMRRTALKDYLAEGLRHVLLRIASDQAQVWRDLAAIVIIGRIHGAMYVVAGAAVHSGRLASVQMTSNLGFCRSQTTGIVAALT